MRNEDLLGLPYRWHGQLPDALDCWQLCRELRRRAELETPDFEWVYEQFTEETFDRSKILRWLIKHGKRTEHPVNGAITFGHGSQGQPCLITSDGDRAWFINAAQRVACANFWELGEKTWLI